MDWRPPVENVASPREIATVWAAASYGRGVREVAQAGRDEDPLSFRDRCRRSTSFDAERTEEKMK
jgi:hypothetical protein